MGNITLHHDGSSVGITFPDDMRMGMGLEAGQEFAVVQLADGLKLVRQDAEKGRQMELAQKVLREQADVLRELATR